MTVVRQDYGPKIVLYRSSRRNSSSAKDGIKLGGFFRFRRYPILYQWKFYQKSYTLKQLPTFSLGLGSRSEKRGRISHFLVLPVSEKYFPGSSAILLSRDIPKFYRGRTFSSEFWPSISVWQLIPRLKSIFANSRIPIAKFQSSAVWQVLISKLKFQNLVSLRSASSKMSCFQNLEFSRIRQFPFNFEVKFKSSYSNS